jgi:two-component system response regulator FlrC
VPEGDGVGLVAKVREHFYSATDAAVIKASPNAQRSFDLAARVAQTDVSVLILGESGTGKEVVARYIHQVSKRAHAPYVAVNCAAIPDTMLEATLFGHVKGSFTGAYQSQPGKFELADGGTLLLDEISEMPIGLQAKLLRALQEREVERVGARAAEPVDVRVIATSNVDLKAAVANGKFREDLYYRLSVFPLHLDPLRERTEDVLALAEHFVAKHGAMQSRSGLRLTTGAQRALGEYSWPGNVRELENTIQRALVLATGQEIDATDLGLAIPGTAPADVTDGRTPAADGELSSRLRGAEEQMILDRLRANNGQRKLTAQHLGISERTLRYKLQKLRAAGIQEI